MGCLRVERGGGSHGPGQLEDTQTHILCSTAQGRSLYDGQIRDGDVGKIECMVERWERESEWFVCWERGGTGDAMGTVKNRTFMRSMSSHIDIWGAN